MGDGDGADYCQAPRPTAATLFALSALSATGCGHHFRITFHAGQQAGFHLTSKPGR